MKHITVTVIFVANWNMIWFFTRIKQLSLFFFVAISFSIGWNTTGITVAGLTGSPGVAANQFSHPFDVVLDSSNALYITDEQNQRVQKWLTNASTGTTVAGSSNATTGSTLDYLNYPSVLLIDSSGNLYVADAGNHRVAYWPNGASSGTLVAGNGRKSSWNCLDRIFQFSQNLSHS